MHTIFRGIWVPIVTPFQGEQIDHPSLARLARHLAKSGVAGLVAGATTGEGLLLDLDEQAALFTTLREAVPELPIILGLSEPATREAVMQARRLIQLAPAGLLVTPPSYLRPTQEGIRRHFEAITEAADGPLLIYNIPYRTGVNVELETLQALAQDRRICGIKECGGNVERMLRLVHETPLAILSGDDNQNFAALCLGAHGTIAASAHLLPHWHVRMFELIEQEQLAAARRIVVRLQPIIRELFSEPNPAPLKAWLAQQGWCEEQLRAPFQPIGPALRERLLTQWQQLQGADLAADGPHPLP